MLAEAPHATLKRVKGHKWCVGHDYVTSIFKDANGICYLLTKVDCIILQLMVIYNENWILSLF